MTREQIKENLIKKAKKKILYYFYENLNISDVEKIINKIPNIEYQPQVVQREIRVDTDKLFDKVSNVINFLSSYKNYTLCERWDGYEDNYFVFIKDGYETDNEIIRRMSKDIFNKCKALSEKRRETLFLKEQKKEVQDKITKLNKQIKSL